jgi:hypothetical protein
MKISLIKKKYKNRWILAQVLKENANNEPVDVKPIITSTKKSIIYSQIAKIPKGMAVTTFYTGKITGSFLLISWRL